MDFSKAGRESAGLQGSKRVESEADRLPPHCADYCREVGTPAAAARAVVAGNEEIFLPAARPVPRAR